MVEFLAFNPQGLFDEIVQRGRDTSVTEQEAFHELVDAVIQGHLQVGEFDEDNALPGLTEQLKGRWSDYREALGLDDETPQL